MYREFNQTDKKIEAQKSLIGAFIELDKCVPDSLEYKALWSEIESYENILELIRYAK